jgi:hypothetical protein
MEKQIGYGLLFKNDILVNETNGSTGGQVTAMDNPVHGTEGQHEQKPVNPASRELLDLGAREKVFPRQDQPPTEVFTNSGGKLKLWLGGNGKFAIEHLDKDGNQVAIHTYSDQREARDHALFLLHKAAHVELIKAQEDAVKARNAKTGQA